MCFWPAACFWAVDPVRQPAWQNPAALSAEACDAVHDACVRLDRLAGSAACLVDELVDMLPAAPPRRLRIVQVDCGRGELTVAIARRLSGWLPSASGHGLSDGAGIELLAIDADQRAIDRAQETHGDRFAGRVEFAVRDIRTEGCPPCDVAIGSLVLQRFADPEAEAVLRSMAGAARLGGVVSELLRSRVGLAVARAATGMPPAAGPRLTAGLAAVRAARTPAEYRQLADRAGLPHATVRRTWIQRGILTWKTAEPLDELIAGMACA